MFIPVTLILFFFVGSLATQPPQVILQLSDIHLSTNTEFYWRYFGDREGDLELFCKRLAPILSPQATLITGDITDSKNAVGAGVQQEEEWQAYRRILDTLLAAGISESSILDLRGNHDVFNMPLRGGPSDFFSRYSSQGRQSQPTRRVFTQRVPPLQTDAGTHLGRHAGVQKESGEHRCPRVAMLGIDATPEPGLRSPANFGGVVPPGLLHEVRQALDALLSSAPLGCLPPAIIASGHYPLSTLDTPMHVAGPRGVLAHITRDVHSMQGMAQLLASFNVSSYVSGHLHAAFGQRLHRMHPTPAGGFLAELETAAWKDDRRFRVMAVDGGALSFSDLFFHTPTSPIRPRRLDAATVKADIWQEAYHVRGYGVTSADPSSRVLNHLAHITYPPDARYSPLAPSAARQTPQQGTLHHAAVAGVGSGAAGRQGKQGLEAANEGAASNGSPVAGAAPEGGGVEGLVRALVFPLDSESAAAPEGWQVSLLSWLPGGAQFSPPEPMILQASQPAAGTAAGADLAGAGRLFQAALDAEVECMVGLRGDGGGKDTHDSGCLPPATHVVIQVEVKGLGGHISTSPRQPVGLRCRPLPSASGSSKEPAGSAVASTNPRQRCWPAPVEAPLPLGTSWLERFILAVNGPVLVHRLFISLWACHVVGLLLLPRVLCTKWSPLIAPSPLFRPRPPTKPSFAPTTTPAGAMASPGQAARSLVARLATTVGGYLLWPAAALVLMARERVVWTAMVMYCVYLVAGPWYIADLLTGFPKAFVFHFGVLIRMHPRITGRESEDSGSWRFIGTADTMFITLVHLVFCVLPLTLWVACVVGSRQLSRLPSVASSSSADLTTAATSSSRGRVDGSRRSSSAEVINYSALGVRGTAQGGLRFVRRVCSLYTPLQWLTLILLIATYGSGSWDKLAKLNGWLAVALSPGVGWTIPLAVLVTVWHQMPHSQSSCLGKRD